MTVIAGQSDTGITVTSLLFYTGTVLQGGGTIIPRTYMHWTAVSAARAASRAAELAAKVTSAQDVLPTSGLLATAMEMPNIDRILAVNITV